MAGEAAGNTMAPPLILAVETSSRMGSVAIALGSRVLAETRFSSPLRHSAEVFPAILGLLDRCGCRPAQIEHVYISGGPGSFTGLRIAAALAKTMNLANAAKIVAVDTLDVVAANVINLAGQSSVENREFPHTRCDRIAAVLDAKRGQFFIAVYERQAENELQQLKHSLWKKVVPDSLMTVREFHARFACTGGPVWLLGDGLVYYRDKFEAVGICFFDETYWSPRACNVHLLGWEMALREQFADPLSLTPNYLRTADVTIKPR